MTHQIDIKDFDSYTFKSMLAGSVSKRENKKLFCVVDPRQEIISFEVFNKGERTFTSYHFRQAIEEYNQI